MNVINHDFQFVLKYVTGNIIEIGSLQFKLSLNFIKAPKNLPFTSYSFSLLTAETGTAIVPSTAARLDWR